MNEIKLCKYYNEKNSTCIAQGELKPICLVPGIDNCQYRDNPKFDRLTTIENRISSIEKALNGILFMLKEMDK
nr:MAG: hypothetical protein [Lokiarchaeota virus Ratatoskr Meg22_1012]